MVRLTNTVLCGGVASQYFDDLGAAEIVQNGVINDYMLRKSAATVIPATLRSMRKPRCRNRSWPTCWARPAAWDV